MNKNATTAGLGRRGFLKRTGAFGAATALGFGATPIFAQETELRMAHIFNEQQPFHKWCVWASDQIREQTDGRYNIQVFPSSSLGGEVDILQGMTLGTIDMGLTGSASASRTFGPMAIIGGPMMFRDFDHWSAYRDSTARADVMTEYNQRSGLHAMASVYYGQRQTSSNRLIETPEDMKGMKLRVPNVPLYLIYPRAVGANPTPISFSEVYLALQQGAVDGQENPLPTIYAQKFHEVQSHVALTDHMIDTLVAQTSGPLWSRLSDADKEVFSAVFQDAMAQCTGDVRAEEEALVQTLRDAGTTVNEVDRDAFKAAVEPMLTGDDLPWSTAEYEQVQAI
ncbi:sialic acid TRAP transporter substrate-binding protein SiaP [Puniceibacterium sp. IMCC21224]|uniref:sialic acid TRAP transporter substrate-binding protein SiaP n=1 Tax=Puniceibacterium sp. IMCC21224 TaxID=1618204 RepID=UPI00065D1C8F|nr:sialic acid TRAP transporter substrate-binding protein SiaP [Puniceibacterium sp. IMCC21224]KMK64971.1 tripartite ATP-independent periplasmic transporter solute receptor, DctP family [Puniceibacterium sp. IMCC21224]